MRVLSHHQHDARRRLAGRKPRCAGLRRGSREAGLSREGAFVLMDMALTSVVLSFSIVAVLTLYAIAAKANSLSERTLVASHLAAELLEEIRLRKWDETRLNRTPWIPTSGSPSLGSDAGEASSDKRTFDDIDDFHGWLERPPSDPVGRALPGLQGYERRAAVAYVTSAFAPSGAPTDYKLVTACASARGVDRCLTWLATNR